MQTDSLHLTERAREAGTSQFKVRTNLRGGTIEACENAINSWKSSYDKWYLDALNSGKLKPPAA
jgi:hypothetical protein